ncbi:MAG: hypothetical protein OEY86_04545 [Nitrospira sp.]|nr:hypothetical protein [Nitrospira sp.]
MKDTRKKEREVKSHQPERVDGTVLDSKDLTCNEAQIEELFSKGESTEGEDDEAGQAEKPAEQ